MDDKDLAMLTKDSLKLVLINRPVGSITAATLQLVLDSLIEDNVVVDYIHGEDVTLSLGTTEGNIGLLLPGIEKRLSLIRL